MSQSYDDELAMITKERNYTDGAVHRSGRKTVGCLFGEDNDYSVASLEVMETKKRVTSQIKHMAMRNELFIVLGNGHRIPLMKLLNFHSVEAKNKMDARVQKHMHALRIF